MRGVLRIRVVSAVDGTWRADVPGTLFREKGHASRGAAIEALRLHILRVTSASGVTSADEMVLRLDVPYTEVQ